jgi:hypothetical protein
VPRRFGARNGKEKGSPGHNFGEPFSFSPNFSKERFGEVLN